LLDSVLLYIYLASFSPTHHPRRISPPPSSAIRPHIIYHILLIADMIQNILITSHVSHILSLPDYCIVSAEWSDLDSAPTFHITSTFPPTYVHTQCSTVYIALLHQATPRIISHFTASDRTFPCSPPPKLRRLETARVCDGEAKSGFAGAAICHPRHGVR